MRSRRSAGVSAVVGAAMAVGMTQQQKAGPDADERFVALSLRPASRDSPDLATASAAGPRPTVARLRRAGDARVLHTGRRHGAGPLAELEHVVERQHAAHLDQAGDEAGPPGLMAGADAGAVVAVEVFVEQHVIAPVRIRLELFGPAVDRPAAMLVAAERAAQAQPDLDDHLTEVHHAARTGRALDGELVAEVHEIG